MKVDVGVKTPLGFIAFPGTLDMSKDTLAKMVSQEICRRKITVLLVGVSIEYSPVWRTAGVATHKVINTIVVLQKNRYGGYRVRKTVLTSGFTPME
jgi:hypothetical protein